MRFLDQIKYHISEYSGNLWCNIEGDEFQYSDLADFIKEYSSIVSQQTAPIGLVIRDDFNTYAAAITIWLMGKTYVPIQPNYPKSRIEDIIELSGIEAYLDSSTDNDALLETLTHLQPHQDPAHNASTKIDSKDVAYILFTSGTTGKPKGVPISFGNLQAFIDGFFDLGYNVNARDRFLQMFELTFDLSVMSFSIPSILGASFYVPSKKLVKPLALYDTLESNEITFALMVPSAVDMLAPYAEEMDLPHLKVTQFCGEALKLQQLKIWKSACAKTQIDNVYGPTEATIYCTRYTVPNEIDACDHHNGIVCIGAPMKTVSLDIGSDQELYLGGEQTTVGYVQATDKQKEAFFEKDGIWFYKSGDLSDVEDDRYYCLGRKDEQVKIQGYRVELPEIEFAAATVYPEFQHKCIASQGQNGWELILVSETGNNHVDINELNAQLPWYMHIKKAFNLDKFPLNTNGKIDKKQIVSQLGL